MTARPTPRCVRLLTPLLALVMSGCAAVGQPASPATPSTVPSTAASASASSCSQVTVVVDFGTLDAPSIRACGPAGTALNTLKAAKVSTEGSGDYGDAVVCRVDGHPSPAQESCAKLPSDAYWALWVKSSAHADWAYAQEGVSSLTLTDGESVGLVYTHGTDSTPPQG